MNFSTSGSNLSNNKFVRPSKFRHLYGSAPPKRDKCYDGLKVSANANDANLGSCGLMYMALHWEASGGGAIGIIPVNRVGRLEGGSEDQKSRAALCLGHLGPVISSDWSPFEANLVVSGSEDCKIGIWQIPDDQSSLSSPVGWLTGHERKVSGVKFHPTVGRVIASYSGDQTVRLWDIEAGKSRTMLGGFNDAIFDMAWDWTGSRVAVCARDKMVRIFDVRSSEQVVDCFKPHEGGIKGMRVVWATPDDNRILTSSFGMASERELALWDLRMINKPEKSSSNASLATDGTASAVQLDRMGAANGLMIPFYDPDTRMIYLAGRGEATIKYYELVLNNEPAALVGTEGGTSPLYHLGEYRAPTGEPQSGVFSLPKRLVKITDTEVFRLFRVVGDSLVEPVSFKVPRKNEGIFQSDLFPDTPGGLIPPLTAQEFFEEAKTSEPTLVSMADIMNSQQQEPCQETNKPLCFGSSDMIKSQKLAKSLGSLDIHFVNRPGSNSKNGSTDETARLVIVVNELQKENQQLAIELTSLATRVAQLEKKVAQESK